MNTSISRKLGTMAAGWAAAALLGMASAGHIALAFSNSIDGGSSAPTSADADTAVNAYLKAFVLPDGAAAFIKGDQNGGDPGFWQEIEEIEGIEDANDRTSGAYNTQVTALLGGFIKAHGASWSNNK